MTGPLVSPGSPEPQIETILWISFRFVGCVLPLPLLLAFLVGPLQTGVSPAVGDPEPLRLPLVGVVTQGVHAGHPAIDIACNTGAPVVAAHGGSGRTHWSSTHGWTFVLQGADGLETRYSHLAQGAPAGQYKAGDLIVALTSAASL